jgi:hypothetical protein
MDGRMVCEHVLATPLYLYMSRLRRLRCMSTRSNLFSVYRLYRACSNYHLDTTASAVLTKLSKHGSANAGKIREENRCTPMPVHERRA